MKKTLLALVFTFLCANLAKAQFTEAFPLSWQGENISHVHIGDSDGDGDYDFFVSNNTTGPRFIENIGDYVFEYPQYMTAGEDDHVDQGMADMDGDGYLDFVSIRPGFGTITLFLNAGDNTFTHDVIYNSDGVNIRYLKIADLDNDGDIDITFRFGLGELKKLTNNGDGTYSFETIIPSGTHILDYHNFDADGDGDLDICYFEQAGSLHFSENLGADYGSTTVIETGVLTLNAIEAFDIDEDGDLDVMYSVPGDTQVEIIENFGDGTFGEVSVVASISGPRLLAPTDIDNDGRKDIIIRNSIEGNNLFWKKNLGLGEYADLEPVSGVSSTGIGEFLDIDGDGDQDLVQVMHLGAIGYNENLGDMEFSEYINLSEATIHPEAAIAMDVDNDGDLDFFCASSLDHKISWVENLGDGHFSHLKIAVTENLLDPVNLESADMDDDGDQDLLAALDYSNKFVWYENLGGGIFGEENLITDEQMAPRFIIAGDWDDDGDQDVIAISDGDYKIMLYESLEGILDETGVLLYEGDWAADVIQADVDGDGDDDILYTIGFLGDIKWFENNGDLTFTHHVLPDVLTSIEKISMSDMDEDGDLDILATAPTTDQVGWIENLGAGLFGAYSNLTSDCDYPTLALYEDINNDGIKDLLISSRSDQTLGWCENLGDLEFTDRIVIADNHSWMKSLWVDDLDQDGDNDVVSLTFGSWQFSWYENLHYTAHSTRGTVFIDENENGVQDDTENGVNFMQALASPEAYYAFTNPSGKYIIVFDETELGDYTIYLEDFEYWGITSAETYDVTIDGGYTYYENLDFGIYPSEEIDEIESVITGGTPRIDTDIPYWLNYSNTGSTVISGNLHLELDEQLTFISADIEPVLIDGQHIYWEYDDLYYFEDGGVLVTAAAPDFESIGDVITNYFGVDIETGGDVVFTSMDSLVQVIQGAYDPNDKTPRPAGTTEYGYIAPETESIEYLVRFQNTGTDTAFLVTIEDQLDPNLDWTSLRPLAWSHDMEIEAGHDGLISFIFNDIMLPDSNVNQLGSNGFVKYEIDLLPGLPLETSIYNTAHIFFDFNPAVITNTTVNTLHVDEGSGIAENSENQITVYPNPFSYVTTIKFAKELTEEHIIIIYDILGTEIYRLENISTQQIQISKDQLGSGLFILTVMNQESGAAIYTSKLLTD